MNDDFKRYMTVAGVTTASLLTGCSSNVKKWENSPGTKGVINLDAVKSSFQKIRKVSDFEKRVNEIFEGDNLVVFSSKEKNQGFVYSAYEDLDVSKNVSTKDDLLFTITISGKTATLQGYGANSYYKKSWLYRPVSKRRHDSYYTRHHYHRPYFHHWYWGRGWGGYYTSRNRYDATRRHRDSYRRTSGFASQVHQNASYENKMANQYGAGFRKAVNNGTSGTRKAYVKTTRSSPSLKKAMAANKNSSGWGMRDRVGASSKVSSPGRSTTRSRSSSYGRSSGRSSSGRSSYGGFRSGSGFGV